MKFCIKERDKYAGDNMKTNSASFPVNYQGEMAKFVVRPAQKTDLPAVVKLFNSRLTKAESALALNLKELKAHQRKDPEGIMLGFLEGRYAEPLTMVGITKVTCAKASDIPATYDDLNPKETDPSGNFWICTWAGMGLGRGEGWSGTYNQRTLNLGQLTFVALTKLAQETEEQVNAVVDFARPKGIRTYLQKKGRDVRFTFNPGEVIINGRYMQHDKNGLFYLYGGKTIRVLDMRQYWIWGEDPVINLHTANGAIFNPRLVFPKGDVRDPESAFFRFGFSYPVS
jgi:hypothetical protein